MNKALRSEVALLSCSASVGLLFKKKRGWATALAVAAVVLKLWPSVYSLRGRSILITGGSRGLGLALAEQSLKEGANVTILARDLPELEQARSLLQERTGRIPTIIGCDVTVLEQIESALIVAEEAYGKIDIVINNAGTIVVGPFASMDQSDFAALLDLQLHAVVNLSQILAQRWKGVGGRIANICSIGGKIAVPHMSTYCAAKFALAGLSQSLAYELARDGITVTTVFPGLMRTGSPIQAVIKGDHESEYAWFALGDTIPGVSVSSTYAVRRILNAIRDGDNELVFPITMKLAAIAQAQFPELFALGMTTAARFFPTGQSKIRLTGSQSNQWLESQPLYAAVRSLMEEAKGRLNQTEKSDAAFNLGLNHSSLEP